MSPATDTTGTIGHPDVSEISELTEGLLSPSRTAEVRSHLGGCPLCADVRASLEEIRALLGTLPGPARMPADISGRIDAALAAEALLDATTPHEEAGPDQEPHTVDEGSGPDVSRETSPALPGGSGGTGALRPSGHPTGPTGPGRRRARRRIALAGGLLAACGVGVLVANLLSGPGVVGGVSARKDAATSQSRSAAPAYSAQGLPGTVRELLASTDRGDKQAGERNNTLGVENSPPADPGLAPGNGEAPEAPDCVRKATGRTDGPLGFERGTYEGRDVFLVVLPHPGDPASVDAYLVGSTCVDEPSAAPGEPLLTRTYPRS